MPLRIDQIVTIIDEILERGSGDLSVSALARSTRVSTSRFAHYFKDTTGLSVHAHITQRRLRKAKDLLLRTSLPIKEITASVGFTNPRHFARIFKKHLKTSPAILRKNKQQK